MKRAAFGLGLFAAAVILVQVASRNVSTQALPPDFDAHAFTVAPTSGTDVGTWDRELTRLRRSGTLRLVRERVDTLLPNRLHERLAQYYGDLPVFGAEATRQSEGGIPISMIGTLYRDINIDASPRLTAEEARDAVLGQPGAATTIGQPELLILPLENGGAALAYRLVAVFSDDILVTFVDAGSGQILLTFTDLQTQTAAGRGVGVLGDTKKISTEPAAGTFRTADGLRPPSIQTYDMKGNVSRVNEILTSRAALGPADLATDADNDWTDGAVVDGHVYAGWTYDYYFKRFGRRGLDNNDLAIRSLVHPVSRDNFSIPYYNQNARFFTNAFWSTALRLMVYGVGLPANVTLGGQRWNFMSGSLDVVAHELTHGVTQFSSNLVYLGESGALNEAFSDIMATGAEFFYAQTRGRGGNYLVGEEVVTPGGIRSMSDPAVFRHPDHYSARSLSSADNFGVHINSGIPNQAFYLAIEGGANRTSGLTVQGVGGSNRDQIEKIFYRAFTLMLPASANFFMARLATIQSARDLYGADSTAERAVTQAWEAVGVRTQAARIGFLFAPDPVPPAPAGQCSLPAPNFVFAVGAAEIAGVPFNVSSSTIRFYNAAGAVSSSQAFNFAQLFNACTPGSNRIPAAALPCAQLCVSFGGAPGGFVDFSVSGVDDLGNQGSFTSSRLRLGTTTSSDAGPAVQPLFSGVK